MDEETRKALSAARIVTKGAIRTLRTELTVLTDLLEKLESLDAQPEVRHSANGNGRKGSRHERVLG